ncbi:zinc-binding dehydrogenase [Pandoraea sputorum]|uniref:zinc-binding dehydrogenase n=1 Tax=Pandoraea sputorum TaxID=93222 RepID=UPI001E3B17CE|nr:zinc-binding dehydrogenase [Pandoraea sputorum]MCE4063386.1 zinc-binding dehydrogenase [Pandoraea sputorum]
MKAWILERVGQPLVLRDVDTPDVRPGAVLVRMEAVPLLSYTRAYLNGELPYQYPEGPFTPGTNGVGTIVATGAGVHHFRVGQRVAVNPYLTSTENVDSPAEVLIGLTGISDDSAPLLQDFPHGTLREITEFPASALVSLEGLEHIPSVRLATLSKFAVPMGGLRRGRLVAGETVVVNGATGAFGSAAVLAALAMGASSVIALGRRIESLESLARLGGERVRPVVLSGDAVRDAAAIRAVAPSGIDLAFDMVGQATDPASTLAALRSLKRRGRMVLMGSMSVPLPLPYGEMLRNGWEVMGHFMYAPSDYRALVAMVRAGQLSLETIGVKTFPFDDLEAAIDAAGAQAGLDATVVSFAHAPA